MGTTHSAGTNRLAITAMARVVHFDKDELLELQKQFQKLSKKDHKNDTTITRKQFHEALKLVKVEATDTEILDRLFTLFDNTGDGQINFKEFIVGVSCIVRGSLEEKLTFSFHLFDVDKSGKISKKEMTEVLKAMNNTVSYFGDDKMADDKVDKLVSEIFDKFDINHDEELNFAEYMSAVAEHPDLVSFISGGVVEDGSATKAK